MYVLNLNYYKRHLKFPLYPDGFLKDISNPEEQQRNDDRKHSDFGTTGQACPHVEQNYKNGKPNWEYNTFPVCQCWIKAE